MGGGRDSEEMEIDGDPFSAFGFSMNGYPRDRNSVGPSRLKQDPPVIHELRVSLEEIYSGCTKRMKISRKRLNPDGRSYRSEDKILTIEIKKGWKEGTKITFPREGDETPNSIPADIVFIIKDKEHPKFKRDGSNIVYTAKISLREVSRGVCCGLLVGNCLSRSLLFPSALLQCSLSHNRSLEVLLLHLLWMTS